MVTLVTSQVLNELRAAAMRAHPEEACGILLGKGNDILVYRETRNVHLTPQTHFEIDPQTLIDAYREERSGGLQVLGFFHSHPNGPARPSETDQKDAAGAGKIWAILGEGEIQLWRDAEKGFEPLSYQVPEE